jgi:ferrous iron transport protein A
MIIVRKFRGRRADQMHDMAVEARAQAEEALAGCVRLSQTKPGDRGVIVEVRADHAGGHGVDVHELERRLLEFGFVEGARLEVLHEGAIRRDPIAVRLDDMRVALRRRDAEDVWVLLDDPTSAPK